MAIRETLVRLLGAKASLVELEPGQLPDRPLEKEFSDADLISTYRDDAWPYILANKIGEQASQAPLEVGRITRDGEFTPMGPDHPVQSLFDDPNPSMDGGAFIHTLMLYMELAGHAPIELAKPSPGARVGAPGRAGQRQRAGFELWLINPDPWRIVPNPDGSIMGYIYRVPQGTDIRWTTEQMAYLRWPNPADRFYGQGRIAAVRQQVIAEEYAALRDKKFEKNLGVPPGILSAKQPLGETSAELLRKMWEKAVGGYSNAGRIAVLGSETTYQAIEMTRKDAEWLASRGARVEIIASAFGVPLPLIRLEGATFSNMQEARAEFWEGTLQPRLNRIARMVTSRVLPLLTTEPLVARFNYDAIEALGENDLQAAQTAKAWADTSSVTVDEVRKRLNLPPHPDGAFGARILVSSTIKPEDASTMAEREQMGMEGQAAAIEATRNPPPQDEPPPRRSEIKRDELPNRETVMEPIRDGYRRDLGAFFTAQRSALNPALPKASSGDIEAIIERLLGILTAKRWRDRILRISEAPISQSLTLGATDAAGKLNVEVTFAISANESALGQVTSHLNTLGVGIQNTTVTDVRSVLTRTLQQGASNAETRAALDELFDGYQDWRLDRIARTETTAAYNLGAIGQYREAGITTVRVTDGDGDENCAPWNGRIATLEEAEGSPLGHPNCTRDWIPIVE